MAHLPFMLDRSSLSAPPDQALTPQRRSTLRRRLVQLLETDESVLPTLLRVTLGGVILGHGLQKVFGWFGGFGITNTLSFFQSIGVPSVIGALVIASDFLGSIALIVGLATRFSAAAAFAVMAGAVLLVHLPNGLFMNWGGAPHGEGYEFHLLALAMAACLVVAGGGRASLDGWLSRKLSR
jgi:putative oxidoreductase